ncbi:MAG: hypothetical protein QOE62_974 [Actinomycetota bacterium]|jgi:hypothetical protein|nr:hypothetical protein [Actinomycetota bacterium]
MFPLPNGSISVFLQPSVDRDGALVLTSPIAKFGDEGTLRTDHALNLWSIPTLRLHYRLEPKSK